MLNQTSTEAAFSATYVDNYLDCVENLPNDLQRLISRMRELDVNFIAHVRFAQFQKDLLDSTGLENNARVSRAYFKMQQALIAAQEIGDEKMSLVQTIHGTIESKMRMLEQNHRSLDIGKDDNSVSESKEPQTTINNATTTPVVPSSERTTKRSRRSRHDTFTGLDSNQSDNAVAEHVLRSQVSTSNAANTSTSNKKTNNKAGSKKGKKKTKSNQVQREETPPREEETTIDPDEPTYCLCDQISYGEMIMCDNDLCPIEWFHFSCVTLTTKPKGRWYCPKCRGDRPNVMKAKSLFLKELERYNKEKEEKT
ncbi:PREDICTED: inhibitor of growth protein 1 isoform X1 [Nicrophorus vespilloides]|uniref:Inhibitor of growth protein n=1 Tax=Nicrophorus vespilloides TaxID=110193 RepID=A0ABM1NCG6_NICVS|nr:PREDICTED: inhibitor of growth protein 1 isoform X1 [Nicrophorus vespilloides]